MPEIRSHSHWKYSALVWTGYFAFFFLIFLQYPLSGALTGNTDTWYNLSIFNDYGNRILAFLTGTELGNAIYPETSNQIFAEPYLGEALTFLVWKIFGISDLWAYFLFIVTTYALNGLGAFLLIRRFVNGFWPAVAGGFAFAASTFAFSQVELLNGIGWSTALFCLYFFHRFVQEKRNVWLFWSMFFGGIQIYSSAYVFVYQCILLVLMVLTERKIFLQDRQMIIKTGLGIVSMALWIFPFAWFYVLHSQISTSWNPFADDPTLIENFNLKPSDLIRSFDHNLIYPQIKHIEYGTVMRNHNYANLGLVIWALAVLGFWKYKKVRWFWGITILIGFLFAFGPSLQVGELKFPLPLKLLYEHTSLIDFLRIPARAFSLVVLGLALFAALGLENLIKKWNKTALILPLAFILIFTVENVPWKFYKIDALRFIEAPSYYQETLSQLPRSTVVANLPSGLFTDNQGYVEGLSVFSREYIYAHWQTKYKCNTLNGSCGYFPKSRLRNNDWMKAINQGENLQELLKTNGVQIVAWHEKLVLSDWEKPFGEFLAQSPYLEKIGSGDGVTLYQSKLP
ncbi:MAG: glycosyltransferase family 39 protein [Bacteroidia bacterium]|nr:glycosyltransferase family 39 protein [Bacteroidia bacterium]